MNIRLSEKYGVNPTIPTCFFCGEHKNEILLMGKLKGDVEAPRGVFDKDPCTKCQEYMSKGVIFISVRNGEEGDNPYRSGGWIVLSDDGVKRMLEGTKALSDILKARCTFLPDEAWDALKLPRGADWYAKQELEKIEFAFKSTGSRSVELAERIDELREQIEETENE